MSRKWAAGYEYTVKEDGQDLTAQASLAACEGVSGSYYVAYSNPNLVISVHPTNDDNPSTNGSVYSLRFTPVTVPVPALVDSLVAFYAMDSIAGADVVDSHGNADDLVDVNGVDRTAGMDGNAADFDIAADEYFDIDAAAGGVFEFAGSFSITCWIYIVAMPDKGGGACYQKIFSRPSGYKGYELLVAAVGDPLAFVLYSDTPGNDSMVSHFASAGTGKWLFVAAVNDADAGELSIWCDDSGSLAQNVPASYSFTQTIATLANTRVGALGTAATSGQLYIDSLAVFDKALTSAEVTWLYNGGAGRVYGDF